MGNHKPNMSFHKASLKECQSDRPSSSVTPGNVNAAKSMPWTLADDRTLVCHVFSSGEGTTKEVKSLAEVVLWITRSKGVTEVGVYDHTMKPLTKAGRERVSGLASSIRWGWTASRPSSPLGTRSRWGGPSMPSSRRRWSPQDVLAMRSTQMGVLFHDKYDTVPCTTNVKVLWGPGFCLRCLSSRGECRGRSSGHHPAIEAEVAPAGAGDGSGRQSFGLDIGFWSRPERRACRVGVWANDLDAVDQILISVGSFLSVCYT